MRFASVAALLFAPCIAAAGPSEDAKTAADQGAAALEKAAAICAEVTDTGQQAECIRAIAAPIARMAGAAQKIIDQAKRIAPSALVASGVERPAPQELPKKLAAADFSVETSKWNDRLVEISLRCFYADKDEFRCLAGSGRVDFASISPPAARQKLENDCDSIAKLDTKACRRTVRFVYQGSASRETGGLGRMVLIKARSDHGEIVGK